MYVCVCMYKRIQHDQRQYYNNNNHKLNAVSLFFFVVAPFLCCSLSVFVPLLVTALCCCLLLLLLLLLPTIELTSMKIFTVLILLDMLLHTLNVWSIFQFYIFTCGELNKSFLSNERFTRTKTSGVVASPFVLCKFLWGFLLANCVTVHFSLYYMQLAVLNCISFCLFLHIKSMINATSQCTPMLNSHNLARSTMMVSIKNNMSY